MRKGSAIVRASACAVLLALAGVSGGAQQATGDQAPTGQAQREPTPEEKAAQHLSAAEQLWADAKYEDCRTEVDAGIALAAEKRLFVPPALARTFSRLYALDALLAYTFRDEGYAPAVDAALGSALQLDPYFSPGDPSEVPAYVMGRYTKLRDAYLARFARTARPNAVGAFAAMVLEPTVFTNPAVLQPGFTYTRSLGDTVLLDAEFCFPLQWPPWSSIRGGLGIILFPSLSIERIATGISLSYVFGLDQLTTYTHSLSFGGRAEWLSRSGLGFAANAELARIDLVVGSSNVTEPPRYTAIPFGLVNVVFANVTLYVFYVF